MKGDDSIDEYFSRTLSIVNWMKMHGKNVDQRTIGEKILKSLLFVP